MSYSKSLCWIRSAAPQVSKRSAQSWVHKWNRFERWQELEKAKDEHTVHKLKMKNFMKLPTGLYITPERPEDLKPKKDRADETNEDTGALPIDLLTNHTQMRYVDHSIDNIKRFNRYQHFKHLQYDQRMIAERLLFLGADLAAAHFLVHRGASVKFIGDDNWYRRDAKKNYSLPGRKVPGLHIEAIDASGTELMFEGFENLYDLKHLRMLRLADCEYIDDWTLGKIGGMMENLEMLDVSGCQKISSKGLMGLLPLKKLRLLRLEGLYCKDLGKAALLLEESIPSLEVLGVDFEEQAKLLEAETRLLENPNVVQDARGNIFAEDDNGRLFYIGGEINERPAVCDMDKPIMTGTIRREVPEMSDEDFDKLDALSGGKLRHLLIGSPSGYEWNEQVETVLQFESKWNKKENIPVNSKMLPESERPRFKPETKHSHLDEEKKLFLQSS
ncbi:unnamed protein product [Auanema sp. JU1783]|nr:unnamed protein product [Auanema sp. JU1783]